MGEDKRQHLSFIQDIVSRQASNSFQLRNWVITIVSAILTFSASQTTAHFTAFVALIPIFLFWILDGYFLWQERIFRALYDQIRQLPPNQIDYSMNVGPHIKGRNRWLPSIFSKTLLIFYGGLLGLSLVVAIYLLN